MAQNLEVVGDRSLLRFYRGHLGVMSTACTMISNYLTWRLNNGVDEVRALWVYMSPIRYNLHYCDYCRFVIILYTMEWIVLLSSLMVKRS